MFHLERPAPAFESRARLQSQRAVAVAIELVRHREHISRRVLNPDAKRSARPELIHERRVRSVEADVQVRNVRVCQNREATAGDPVRGDEGVDAVGAVIEGIMRANLPAPEIQRPVLTHQVPAAEPVPGALELHRELRHGALGIRGRVRVHREVHDESAGEAFVPTRAGSIETPRPRVSGGLDAKSRDISPSNLRAHEGSVVVGVDASDDAVYLGRFAREFDARSGDESILRRGASLPVHSAKAQSAVGGDPQADAVVDEGDGARADAGKGAGLGRARMELEKSALGGAEVGELFRVRLRLSRVLGGIRVFARSRGGGGVIDDARGRLDGRVDDGDGADADGGGAGDVGVGARARARARASEGDGARARRVARVRAARVRREGGTAC